MSEVDKISGEFIGAYAIHPLTGKRIPIWIGDYVLAGYGTGAVMSVPAGDSRDYKFAKHFGIEIPSIFKGKDISEGAFEDKENFELENSDFLNGLSRSEEHTSELQSRGHLVCRLLLEKKKSKKKNVIQ